jgi:hypothetical protein
MSKHTPGPWRVVTPESGRVFVRTKYMEFVADCSIRVGPGNPSHAPEWRGEVEANAALIAAAPELLQACKDAYAYLETVSGEPSEAEVQLAFKLKRAIAEGEL